MEPESYPIKLKRDLRVSSPQPLYRALADLLEEQRFQVRPKQPPVLEAGVLSGTATFSARLLGVRDLPPEAGGRPGAVALLAAGAALIAAMASLLVASVDVLFPVLGMVGGAVLEVMGLGRLRVKRRPLRRLLDLRLEGESYHAGATKAAEGGVGSDGVDLRVERTGVISDVRLTVYAGVGYAEGDEGVSQWLPEQEEVALGLVAQVAPSTVGEQRTALPATTTSGVPARRLDQQLDILVEQFALARPEQ